MVGYTFTINGNDRRKLVYYGGYSTKLVPVYSRAVTTLDGVDHKKLIRHRGSLTVTFNELSDADAAALFDDLSTMPATVTYFCKQRGQDVTAKMTIGAVELENMAFMFQNKRWNERFSLTFTEL